MAEFSIAEFATAIGLPTEVGKAYVGEALELRHRLPKTWAQVLDGKLPAWRARRIARATIGLSAEAAAYVDAKVWFCAHTIRTTALDRLIATAITQFMPAEAEARQQAAADGRHVDIDTRHHDLNGLSGTATLHGTLDLADALDLDSAISQTAATLKELGSEESLDVRRAVALGEIARRDLTLDLSGSSVEEVAQQPSRNPRTIVLNLHLAADAVTGTGGRSGTSAPHSRSSSSRSGPGAVRPVRSPSNRSSTSPSAPPWTGYDPTGVHGRTGRAARPALRLPLVQPPSQEVRQGPRRALETRRPDLRLQPRPPLPEHTTGSRPTADGATWP